MEVEQSEASQKIIDRWNTQPLFKPSWDAFVRVWPQMIAGSLIMVAIGAVSALIDFVFSEEEGVRLFFNIVSFVFQAVIQLGLYQISLKGVVGIDASMSDLFDRWKDAGKYLFSCLMLGVMMGFIYLAVAIFLPVLLRDHKLLAFLALVGPAFYMFVRFGLFGYFMVDQDMGPFAALKSSYVYTADCQARVMISVALMAAVVFAGALLFGVGLVVAVPLSLTILARTYRDVVVNCQGLSLVQSSTENGRRGDQPDVF